MNSILRDIHFSKIETFIKRKGVYKTVAFSYTNKKSQQYFLHRKVVTLRGGNRQQTIYYFAKQAGEGAIDEVPQGFEVVENKKTGLPVLRRT